MEELDQHGKEPEADDPFELVGSRVAGGDPAFMATCIAEEYARMGMDEQGILRLFRDPAYQLHALFKEHGEQWLRSLVQQVLCRAGRMQVSITVLHQIGGAPGSEAVKKSPEVE